MNKEQDQPVESTGYEVRRKVLEMYSAERKLRIVLEGLRGEVSISELCRREGIHPNMYHKWAKEFLDAGKQRLAGNAKREAHHREVDEQLKALAAELTLRNRLLKKSLLGRESK